MKLFPKEAWRYAILLIILFAIASVTVREILAYLQKQISPPNFHIVTILMFSLTLGFMSIAGAFGLWAIRFSAEAESRRRIGQFVDTMDYLNDGLLTLDDHGIVTAFNPAARALAPIDLQKQQSLRDLFPALSEVDVSELLQESEPHEIERTFIRDNVSRVVRLRSQPAQGITFLLLSDITATTAQLAHTRQLARLQLIGELARGVAHDFNNVLCVISGHASLLQHVPPGSVEMSRSINQIVAASERGTAMANHLLDLSHPVAAMQPTDVAHEYIDMAVQMLRDTLPDRWKVQASVVPLPAVAFTGLQLEQILLNLGYLCADAMSEPGILRVTAARPGPVYPCNVGNHFAGVLIVSANSAEALTAPEHPALIPATTEAGVILSVLKTLIEEAGGTLEQSTTDAGYPAYRATLPFGSLARPAEEVEQSVKDLAPYIAHWSVLLAVSGGQRHADIEKRLRELSVNVRTADNIVSALALIEQNARFDGIIVDRNLLKNEAEGLLRAMAKLCPDAGIVALSENPRSEPLSLSSSVSFAPLHADVNNLILSMVEAKNIAARRKHAKTS